MDVLQAGALIHTCLQIGNLSQWNIDRKTWTLRPSLLLAVYTVVVITVSVAFLLHGLFSGDDFGETSENDVGETVDFIQMVGIRVAHVVSLTEAFARRKNLKIFFEQVRDIDRIFECSLNVDVNNRSLRRTLVCRAAVMFSIYLAAEAFMLISKLLAVNGHFSLYWLFYLLPFLVCGLRYFQIISTIIIVKERFDRLIDVLSDINLVHKSDSPNTIKMISNSVPILKTAEYHRHDTENPDLKRLFIVRDIYNRLWELTSLLNHSFGFSMLINVGNDFLSITSSCYWIFLNFTGYSATVADFLHIASSAVLSVPHLLNVLALALLCERTIQRTTAIALGLHRIETNIWNDNHNTVMQHRSEFLMMIVCPMAQFMSGIRDFKTVVTFILVFIKTIEQFSLQLLHQKLSFSAAGFFDVNCSLLYMIAGATTTYLIILIQFHMSEEQPTTSGG